MSTLNEPGAGRRRPHGRRWALLGLVVLVVDVHFWIAHGVMAHWQGGGEASRIKRMQASLVADMELTEPPVVAEPSVQTPPPELAAPAEAAPPVPVASAASKPRAKLKAKPRPDPSIAPVTSAASAATDAAPVMASAASAPASEAEVLAEVVHPHPAVDPETHHPIPIEPPASHASGPAFEWPRATRVTFKVEGYLRGPIYGSALVAWFREDLRYQVHVDATLGPSFAPLGSRRWTSEGTITADGLSPQRFESVDKLLIKSSAAKVITFEATDLVLPSGERVPKWPGVQDMASHYIQLAYQFILNPQKLQVGSAVQMPVSTTKRQEMVTYDVQAEEMLDTPLGKVDTFRLQPRKLTDQKADVLAEIWIAPGLQYLPVRMLVRQGEKNYLDMHMDRKPQQTSAAASAAAPATVP